MTATRRSQVVAFLFSTILAVGAPSAPNPQLAKDLHERNPKHIDVIIQFKHSHKPNDNDEAIREAGGVLKAELGLMSLFTGWRAFSEQVLKILLDKFRDFGYVKLREFEHGVAEELPSSWPHRKIKAEDRLSSAAVAQYSPRE